MPLGIGEDDGFSEWFRAGGFRLGPVFDRLSQRSRATSWLAIPDQGAGLKVVEDSFDPLRQRFGTYHTK
jgi:hypothetical protein